MLLPPTRPASVLATLSLFEDCSATPALAASAAFRTDFRPPLLHRQRRIGFVPSAGWHAR